MFSFGNNDEVNLLTLNLYVLVRYPEHFN